MPFLLKTEQKRRGVTFAHLVEKLGEIGIDEKDVHVRISSLVGNSQRRT